MPDDLTMADVERIAALARLALTDDEKALYAGQLARILEYARQVAELDSCPVAATASVTDGPAVERPDIPRATLGRDAALANAPDAAAGLFRVPKVLGDA
jgi:aspartyl-tRNA(Asn)/glutamyl-tRNA(Gln) amidotransferase subunit C